jgi:hypothetical protein
MAGDAYNDLAGRPSTKRLVEATTIKDWTSHVTSGNSSRLTPLTGVKHSAGRKCTENRRLNTCPFLLTFSESLNPPDPPLPGCFLEQLGSGVLPFTLDCPNSVQSTSTCPPPETDEEIGHDDAINDASPSRPENEHSASACPSPVAQTSPVPDSTDYVSASESEDILELPVPRGLSGLKRRPSESLFLLSGSDADRGPKDASLAELGEGTGHPPDAHEHLPAGAVSTVSDTGAGSDGSPDSAGATGTPLPSMRPGFEYISDGTFPNQTISLYRPFLAHRP